MNTKKMKYSQNFRLVFFLVLITILMGSSRAYAQWCAFPVPPAAPPPATPPDPCCSICENGSQGNCNASPSYAKSGNYSTSSVDLQLPTRGTPLSLMRTYDSVRAVDGLFGKGWSSNLTGRIAITTYLYSAPSTFYKEALVFMPNGRPVRFRENADGVTYTPVAATHDSLVKNPDGSFDLTLSASRFKYHFGSNGSLLSFVDEYGNTLSFSYDGSNRLFQVSDGTGSGRLFTFYYGPDGRVSSVADSADRTVTYGYNASGSLISVIDPENRQTNYSYVNGRYAPLLYQIKDKWLRIITTITYDTDRTKTYTEAGETYTYTYNYQGDASKTAKADSFGRTSVFTFDSQGLITDRVPPSGEGGAPVNTVFNPDGSIQTSTDEVGVKTNYTYNANGTVASVIRDYQGSMAVRFDYSYDPNFPDKVTAITPKNPATGALNLDWQAWKYDYYQTGSTAPGALFHVYRVRNDGVTQDTLATYTYNSAGQVLTVTDASAAITSYAYNPTTGDLISVTYPKNSTSGTNPVYQYGRDTAGRVNTVTDPLGKITTYTYDKLDRIKTVTLPKPSPGSPLNFVTTYTYDVYDSGTSLLFTHQTDPNAKLTKQGYDQFGQMVRSIDAAGKITIFTYNKGMVASIKDANNNTTNYNYNGLRRLTSTQFPDTAAETYLYYPDGLLSSKTDRKNETVSYTYDALKRLSRKNYPNGTFVEYNYTGQKLDSVNDTFSGETHSFSYDPSYRVSSNTQGVRGTIGYTYDASDRMASYLVQGGPSTTYAYYQDGSLDTITWSGAAGVFKYVYTLTGQYGSITFPNGQHRDFSYDDQGRLLQIANIHPTAGNLATYAYGYDVDNYTGQSTMRGQRSSVTMNIPSLSFTNTLNKYYYDANYQLNRTDYPAGKGQNTGIEKWTYDSIGNRTQSVVGNQTKNYTYFKNGSNPLNGQRLQSDGSNSYTYDSNGNMLTRQSTNFTWDYENRLTGVVGTSSYTYDYLGRRKTKTVSSVTTTYLYDGQNLVYEMSGSTPSDYLFGPGIDEPLAISRNAQVYYYSTDGLGSVGIVSDANGVVKNKYSYDAWGVIKSQTTTISNPFGYTSREFSDIGTWFYRNRYMLPAVGRFISEDPISFHGGINFYTYTRGNPVNFIDPDGLKLRITQKQAEIMTEQMEAMTLATAAALVASYAWEFLVLSPALQQTMQKCSVQQNREIGNKFRDEIAQLLQKEGLDVVKEVYKRTIFGKRFIDIEVSKGGRVLGGIETKVGNSAYTTSQRAKDAWLRLQGYIVDLVRDNCGCK